MAFLFFAYIDYSFLWERPSIVFSPPSEVEIINSVFFYKVEDEILKNFNEITHNKLSNLLYNIRNIPEDSLEEFIKVNRKMNIENYIEAKLVEVVFDYVREDYLESKRESMVLIKDPLVKEKYKNIAFYYYILSSFHLSSFKYSEDVRKNFLKEKDFFIAEAHNDMSLFILATFATFADDISFASELFKKINVSDFSDEIQYLYYYFYYRTLYRNKGEYFVKDILMRENFYSEKILGLTFLLYEERDYDILYEKLLHLRISYIPQWVLDVLNIYFLNASILSKKYGLALWSIDEVRQKKYYKLSWYAMVSIMMGESFYFRRNFKKALQSYISVSSLEDIKRMRFYFLARTLEAWTYVILRRNKEALETFDAVIDSSGNPMSIAMAYLGKGFLLLNMDDLEGAYSCLRVIKISPQEENTPLYERINLKTGHEFRFPILIQYYIPFSLYLYGALLEKEKKFDEASFVYRKIFTDFPYKPFSIFAYMKYIDYNIKKGIDFNKPELIKESFKARERVRKFLKKDFPYMDWYLTTFIDYYYRKDTTNVKYIDEISNLYNYLHNTSDISDLNKNFLGLTEDSLVSPCGLFFLEELRCFYILKDGPDYESFAYFVKDIPDSLFSYISDTVAIFDIVHSLISIDEDERARDILSLLHFNLPDRVNYSVFLIAELYIETEGIPESKKTEAKNLITNFYPDVTIKDLIKKKK